MTKRTVEERINSLARTDKWYLSAGDGILWAPAFPVWLDHPGFWDEAHIYYHPFAPLFSVALVSAEGQEIPLRQLDRIWRPDRLVSRYRTPHGPVLVETKVAIRGGRFCSIWKVEGNDHWAALAGAHLVAFTAQPGEQVAEAREEEDGVSWVRTLCDRREQAMAVRVTLGVFAGSAGKPRLAAVRSEGSAVHPHFRFAPFLERWDEDGLRQEIRLEGITDSGLMYAAVDQPVPAEGEVTFSIDIVPEQAEFRLAHAPAQSEDRSAKAASSSWNAFFDSFPDMRCSDPYLQKYLDYRIYGLFLNRLEGGAGNVRHPAIAEGISYFHVPITYSGQCHMFEMRWSKEPDVARGTLLNFLETQREDGSFNGRIYTNHLIGTDFYHANWGDAVLELDASHPDDSYIERVYPGLSRYAAWLDETRDRESCGMYDVINHFETGQEFMSRYQAVNPKADLDGWKDGTHLKAIDATVYVYQLKRALATMAERLSKPQEAEGWKAGAAQIGRAIMERMWDPEVGMFSDIDPRTMERTGVKAAVCFYPLLTDLLEEEHVSRLLEHLTNPEEFATPWPVPSSSVDDPLFDADAQWKGKRHVCPWNGRVWPMTNSHVIEGLMRQWGMRDLQASSDSARWRAGTLAGELLTKYVKVMFHGRDLDRPNCFEHYNPYTGHACEYRGIDDYQHSWVLDLLIRALGGVEPGRDGVMIDPIPMDVASAAVHEAVVAGRCVTVRREGESVAVHVDGKDEDLEIGQRIELPV